MFVFLLQALAISRALRQAEDLTKAGERRGEVIEDVVQKIISASGGVVDYAEVTHVSFFFLSFHFSSRKFL